MSTKGQEMVRRGCQTIPGMVRCITVFDEIAGYCSFTPTVSPWALGISAAC